MIVRIFGVFERLLRMDKIDRKILAILQANGRISLTELAEKVNISLSPCQRRVKALEQEGIIENYQTNLNSQKLGLGFSAIVFASLKKGDTESMDEFEGELKLLPEVVQAQRLFGDPDYMMYIVTKNLDSFRELYDKRLAALPHVLRLSSTLVMKEIVKKGLPIGF